MKSKYSDTAPPFACKSNMKVNGDNAGSLTKSSATEIKYMRRPRAGDVNTDASYCSPAKKKVALVVSTPETSMPVPSAQMGLDGKNTKPSPSSPSRCNHPATFAGLCVVCGIDIAINTDQEHAAPTINIGHLAQTAERSRREREGEEKRDSLFSLMRSTRGHAKEIASSHFAQMIQAKKLVLVLDIDHTLLHSIDRRTIGWDKGKCPPGVFELLDGVTISVLRPGLSSFLESVHHLYEIHLCTMGIRSYAKEVAHLMDPNKKYFRGVVTRDDHDVKGQKNLQSLMVEPRISLIMDDCTNVWHEENHGAILKVDPFLVFIEDTKKKTTEYRGLNGCDQTDTELYRLRDLLQRVHETFYRLFGHQKGCSTDVRTIMQSVLLHPTTMAQDYFDNDDPDFDTSSLDEDNFQDSSSDDV